jgi:hypothetical protein
MWVATEYKVWQAGKIYFIRIQGHSNHENGDRISLLNIGIQLPYYIHVSGPQNTGMHVSSAAKSSKLGYNALCLEYADWASGSNGLGSISKSKAEYGPKFKQTEGPRHGSGG